MSEMQSRIVEPASHDLISHDLTPQDIIRAFATVCKMALDVIGGSRASQGESQRFLADMETLVAVVDGRPYQPRTRDKDALAELDDLDDILDRVFSKLCVEFGSKTDNLAACRTGVLSQAFWQTVPGLAETPDRWFLLRCPLGHGEGGLSTVRFVP
jgi:hypothetical protein